MKKFTVLMTFVLATIITGSAFAHDVKVSSTDKLTIESFDFGEPTFMGKQDFIISFKNNTSNKINAFKTRITCNDLFDEEFFTANYKNPSANIKPGASLEKHLDVPGMIMYNSVKFDRNNFNCFLSETMVAEAKWTI